VIKQKIKIFTFLICIFGLWFLVFDFSRAQTRPSASLFFAPISGTYAIGETFNVGVRLSSPSESTNAAQGTISFPNDTLEVVRISHSGSIFTLWPQEPAFSNTDGTISFAGGLPNPGFKGESALIFTIGFRGKNRGQAKINFTSGTILANDGFGTDITKLLGSGNYIISTLQKPPAAPPSPPTQLAAPSAPSINSPTHPDQNRWYAKRQAETQWQLPTGITGVSVFFNQYPTSNPGNISDGLFSSKLFDAEKDGVWYLHIKFKNAAGWGAITHFKVQVDTEPPFPFSIFLKEDGKTAERQPNLIFESRDAASGIDYYEIIIDLNAPIFWQRTATSTNFKVPQKLEIGKHNITVKAFDFAGNFQIAEKEIEITEILSPIIDFITSKLWHGDPIVAQGQSPPESNVVIKITDRQTGKETSYETTASKSGQWFFILKETLPAGNYNFRAAAVTPDGIQSPFGQSIIIVISRPILFYLWLLSIVVSIAVIIILAVLVFHYRKKKPRRK